MPTARTLRPTLTTLLAALVVAGGAGCSVLASAAPDAGPDTTQSAPEASETPDAGPSAPLTEDALAEREAFFAAQGQPRDGSLPTPQTPEQQRFVDEQRAYVQAQGGEWDEFYDGVALAATLDACETSILNGHDVSTATAQAHIDTSPLIAEIAQGDAAAEQGLASIMVFGTGFVCPADAPQWEAAFAEIYP